MTNEELKLLGIENIYSEKDDAIKSNQNIFVFTNDENEFVKDKINYLIKNKMLPRIKKIGIIHELDEQNDIIDNDDKYIVKPFNSFILSEIIPFFYSYKGMKHKQSEFKKTSFIKKKTKEELITIAEKDCIIGAYEDENKNFLSEIALDILKSTNVAKEYMMYTYEWLFIDDIDDILDESTLELLNYISNELGIKLCIINKEK